MGPAPDPELLLRHDAWMRGLASALVRDPAAADDLVQETWLAAVRNPRASRGDASAESRPWLSTVLRNAAKQWRRSTARRTRHELEVRAGAEPVVGSTAHSVEQLELRRELIDAVLALPEAQRDAISLRFLDELPPRRIAAQLAVPVATVHTRIERGLARLRGQLDQRHGSRAAWAGPWVAWCSLRPAEPLVTTAVGAWIGVGIMSAKAKVVWSLAAGIVASSVLYWLWSDPAPVEPVAEEFERAVAAPLATADQGEQSSVGEAPVTEVAQRAEAETRDNPEQVDGLGRVVRGQVLRFDGVPLPRVGVRASSHYHEIAASPAANSPPGGALEGGRRRGGVLATVRTDEAGRFELATEDRAGFLVVDEPGWATVYAGDLRGEAGEVVVIAARERALRGVVRGPEGQPLGSATIEVRVDQSLRTRLDRVLDRSHDANWVVQTDPLGRFDLAKIPHLTEAYVEVRHTGYVRWRKGLAELPADTVIELVRPEAKDGVIQGLVLDAFSQPVPNAWVGAGRAMTRTEPDGTFFLSQKRLGDAQALSAVAEGWLPARFERAEAWPDYVELRLEAEALALSGRVVDAAGTGVAGARVWVVDPTTVGAHNGRPIVLEGVSGGVLRAGQAKAKPGLDAAERRRRTAASPSMVWEFVNTDASGAFRIPGLTGRDYRVAALDPATLVSVEAGAVRAGRTDVELRLPTDRFVQRLRGRVLTTGGAPVAGVVVRASKIVAHVSHDGASWMRSAQAATTATTDADGRFELNGVPHAKVSLQLSGDSILPGSFSIDEVAAKRDPSSTDMEWSGIELQASLRFHVQAVVRDPSRGNRVAVLDAGDELLSLTVFLGAGNRMMDEYVPLHEGKSAAFVVPEGATTLVLFDGTREVARTRLELTAGQLNRVEL